MRAKNLKNSYSQFFHYYLIPLNTHLVLFNFSYYSILSKLGLYSLLVDPVFLLSPSLYIYFHVGFNADDRSNSQHELILNQ